LGLDYVDALFTGNVDQTSDLIFVIESLPQGTLDAYEVQINDYVPDGLILNDSDWAEALNVAILNTAIPFIAAGDQETVTITFMVDPNFEGLTITNNAEILSAELASGALAVDNDSSPNNDQGANPDPNDDDVDDQSGTDDYDPAVISIVPNAGIGDYVWIDLNADGIQDDNEVGIDSVIVNVFDINGILVGTDTTDVDGFYLVEDLAPGDYQVEFVLDSLIGDWNLSPQDAMTTDSLDSDPNDMGLTIFTNLSPGEIDTSWDAGIYQFASIGDFVWKDADQDGIQDADELGIPNVTVLLQDCDGNNVAIALTNASGFYLFTDVIPGEYVVQFDLSTVPEECTLGLTGQGNGTNDSDALPDGSTPCIEVESGDTIENIDAGFVPVTVNLGDYVWHDLDANGIQNSGEPGIEGVIVNLYNDDTELIATTTTDVNGFYIFEDVIPDTYFVEFIDPDGFTATFAEQGGNDAIDSDITNEVIIQDGGSTTDIYDISIEDNYTIDAGYYRCVPIGEQVWYDIDTDNVEDPIENGINGMKVTLWRLVDGTYEEYDYMYTGHKPGTPSDDGYYKFCAPPGTYYLHFQLPPIGLVQAQPNVGNDDNLDSDVTNANGLGTTNSFTVTSGQEICNIGAGYYPMAEVGNFVWNDANQNGIQEEGEAPMQDVMVQAFDLNDNKVSEVMTDENGEYNMEYLQQESYYLKFTPPAGYGATVADAGER